MNFKTTPLSISFRYCSIFFNHRFKLLHGKGLLSIWILCCPLFLVAQGSGHGLVFNGINQGVDLGDVVANNSRTIEIWFKPHNDITSSLSNPVTLMARDFDSGNAQSTNEFAVAFYPAAWGAGGRLAFSKRDGSVDNTIFSDRNFWEADHWYHIAVTIEMIAGMKMYINGELQQSTAPSNLPIGIRSGSASDKVSLGKWGNLDIRFFTGEMDEVRIWEVEKSQIEIREKMCSKLEGNELGLKAYYRFDNLSGNTATDASFSTFDGTLLNMDDSNRIYSGAPLGDTSTYLYSPTSLAGQSLLLDISTGDQLLASDIVSMARGIHLYQVAAPPNALLNLSASAADRYYGVFLTDLSGEFDLQYEHADYGCSSCTKVFSRNDNAVLSWSELTGTSMNCSYSLSDESSLGDDYRAEYILEVTDDIVLDLGPDRNICPGETIILDAMLSNVNYLWQDNSTASTYAITSPGTYWVEVSSSCGVSTDTINIGSLPPLELDLGADTTICSGATLTLDVEAPSATYVWQDNSTSATYTITESGIYWVEVANNCEMLRDTIVVNVDASLSLDLGPDRNLCPGETIILDANLPNSSYLWQDNSTADTFMVTEAGIYWVEVMSECGLLMDTINITSLPPLALDLGADTSLCPGATLTLNVESPNATYVWQDNSASAMYTIMESGIYWVEVTNACEMLRDTIVVNVEAVLNLDLGPDRNLCPGETLTLDANLPNSTYLWQDNSTADTFVVTEVGTYWVEVMNDCGTMTDTIEVGLSMLDLDLGPDTSLCLGETITLDATAPNATYLWQDGSTSATLTVTEGGTYSVRIADGCNQAEDEIEITYQDLSLSVDLGGDQVLCYGDSITLDASTINGATYVWQDGTESPRFVVRMGGVYEVMVGNACEEQTEQVSIIGEDCCNLYIPNVFTPNFDGINDDFRVYFSSENCDITFFSMKIFDRWGEQVFETNDPEGRWDGEFLGQKAHNGVYVWVIEYTNGPQAYLEKGDVSILR